MSSFLKKGGIVVAIVGSIVGLQSCLDDDNNYYYNTTNNIVDIFIRMDITYYE